MSDIELVLDGVAADLDWMDAEPVFVGGAIVGLFLDAFGRSQLRPTRDVDCIVPKLGGKLGWWALEEELRRRRWSPDPDGPLCRYISPRGTLVDLMTPDPTVLGFSSRWYPHVLAGPERRTLSTGREVWVPTTANLVACKLEAWESRGVADPYASKDLEDIASLLDGARDLESSFVRAESEVREWIRESLGRIFEAPAHEQALLGQLPRAGDAEAQEARIGKVVDRLCRSSE